MRQKFKNLARNGLCVGAAVLLAAGLWGGGSGPGEAAACTAEEADTVIPVGKAVGIKLFSKGVMVVGLSEVETEQGTVSPARDCGLREGDIITEIDRQAVSDIDQVAEVFQETGGKEVQLSVLRGGNTLSLTGEAVACAGDGSYRFGAWLRDSMAGIGTVTWYDPADGSFAALGHGINDIDTGLLIPIRSGGIMSATVSGLERGEAGRPGQLHGTFDLSRDVGALEVNSDWGVFGTAAEPLSEAEPVQIAEASEVTVGAAEILANVEGDKVERFQVRILRVYPRGLSQTRNMMVEITDERLLSKTGGILQGMSGAPILQNGKLVGAVTHVLVDDPTRGYGIFAENMRNKGAV